MVEIWYMFHTFCHTYTYLSTIQIQNTLVTWSPQQKMTKKGFGLASDLFDTLSMHGFDNIACFLGAFLSKNALRNFERGSKRILNEMNKKC